MLGIRLPVEVENRLDELAKRTGRTKTYYAREAILHYIEDLEDIYDAEQAIADIASGRGKLHAFEDVCKELGL